MLYICLLRSVHRARLQRHRVQSLSRVRGQRLTRVHSDHWEPDLFLFPDVPVALLVEVGKAHVIGVDVHHLLLAYFDLTADVVLSL